LLKNDIFLCHCEAFFAEAIFQRKKIVPHFGFRLAGFQNAELRLPCRQAGRPKKGLLAMTNDIECTNICVTDYDNENFNSMLVLKEIHSV